MSFPNEINIEYPKFIINFLVATCFATSFIAFFFFTYAKNVERQIVVDNVNYLIDDLTSNLISFTNDDTKEVLISQINSINLGDMSEEDKKVEESNKKLLTQSFKLFGTLLIINLTLAYIIARFYEINFEQILISNIMLLFAIALTEYFFLDYIIIHYISVDPNRIKGAIFDSIFDLNH
jgi:hypothetical protein